MNKTAYLLATLSLVLGSLHAQTVPPFLNYQGRVTDSGGGVGLGNAAPVNRKIVFRIWDTASSGGAALSAPNTSPNRLWTEEQTVTIANGDFSVLLGQGIAVTGTLAGESRPPLDTIFTSSGVSRFLEVIVDSGTDGITGSDSPISPRQQLTSTAYAFRARAADTIAGSSDLTINPTTAAVTGGSVPANYGIGWYGTGRTFNGTGIDGPVLYGAAGGALGSVNGATQVNALRWNAAGQVGIGSATLAGALANTKLLLQGDDTGAPPVQFNIRGNTDTTKRLLIGYNTTDNYGAIQAYNGASTTTNLLLNQAGGNVGIGTTITPATKLEVGGSILARSDDAMIAVDSNGEARLGIVKKTGINPMIAGSLNTAIQFGHSNQLNLTNVGGATFTERMRINPNGNVGIGTTTPNHRLQVHGNMMLGTGAPNTSFTPIGDTLYLGQSRKFLSTTLGTAFNGSTDWLNLMCHSGSAGMLFGGSTSDATPHVNPSIYMAITNGGNVGIGTTSPTQAKLVVSGGGSGYNLPAHFSLNFNGTSAGSPANGLNDLSLLCSGRAVAATFSAASDERIKNIDGITDGAADLETVLALQVTDYHYIDVTMNAERPHKKLIAQQVEKVFPQAVSKHTDAVPDIYKKAVIKDGWIMLATSLKKGERVRIIGNTREVVSEVIAVEKDRFRAASHPEGESVVVFGREVKDFRTVDYEAISS